MKRRVLIVFGTRPEAIKLAPVVLHLSRQDWCEPIVAVTGQHREMLDQVLTVFGITPDVDLDLHRPQQTLTSITTGVLTGLERQFELLQPHLTVVQGDTTTTMASALASFYARVPIAHVEAGLRTGDMRLPFPEEANRKLTGTITDLHLAATPSARDNLLRESVKADSIVVTGNTVIDALLATIGSDVRLADDVEAELGRRDKMLLVTAHRRESWGDGMASIARAVRRIALRCTDTTVLFPIHRNPIVRDAIIPVVADLDNVLIIEPLPYAEFCAALNRCDVVITDSGGVQEEAPSLGKPVLVMRDTTERPEAIAAGAARLVGTDEDVIVSETVALLTDATAHQEMSRVVNPYGDGFAADRISAAISEFFGVGTRLPDFSPQP